MAETHARGIQGTLTSDFFVKDRIDKKEIRVEYCPSSIMLADFFTKTLQGALFKKLRDVIMGYRPISDLI